MTPHYNTCDVYSFWCPVVTICALLTTNGWVDRQMDGRTPDISAAVLKVQAVLIRSIGEIHRYITTDACHSLVQSTVTSRLDNANVPLHNFPKSLLYRLQIVQNTCAWLVIRKSRMHSISPVLVELRVKSSVQSHPLH